MNAFKSRVLLGKCREVIGELTIPNPFDLDEFVAMVAQRRGKRIELIRANLGATAPCGMLVGTVDVDYVCYASNTTVLHARHIVVHELGHLLFGHLGGSTTMQGTSGSASADGDRTTVELPILRLLMPHLEPAMIINLLGRTVYASEHEQEAEVFASLVLSRHSPQGSNARRIPRRSRTTASAGSGYVARDASRTPFLLLGTPGLSSLPSRNSVPP